MTVDTLLAERRRLQERLARVEQAGDRLSFILDHCSYLDLVGPVTLDDVVRAQAAWRRLVPARAKP